MKKYLNAEEFVEFLDSLEPYKIINVFTESEEDGSESAHKFMKIWFSNSTIILYTHPYDCIGIIQDTPIYSWDDYAREIYNDDFAVEGEYKLFIKED